MIQHIFPVRRACSLLATISLGAGVIGVVGCHEDAPPPRVGPLSRYEAAPRPSENKPLPMPGRADLPPPPFDDAPLVYQPVPEQKEFIAAYEGVHRPRIAVFVNRTLDGDVVPVNVRAPDVTVERRRYGPGGIDQSDRADVYIRPGQYDEAYAKQIDYAAIENVLTQWIACDGQTTIASPSAIRERLTEDEIRRLQQGRPRVLGELAKQLNTDVLIQVQAKPTRQTERGLEVRLIAEAINVEGGESIARATVLIPPPLDSEKINRFTRYVARRLMADMTMTWSGPGPAKGGAAAPAVPPAGAVPPPADPSHLPPATPQINPPDAGAGGAAPTGPSAPLRGTPELRVEPPTPPVIPPGPETAPAVPPTPAVPPVPAAPPAPVVPPAPAVPPEPAAPPQPVVPAEPPAIQPAPPATQPTPPRTVVEAPPPSAEPAPAILLNPATAPATQPQGEQTQAVPPEKPNILQRQ